MPWKQCRQKYVPKGIHDTLKIPERGYCHCPPDGYNRNNRYHPVGNERNFSA